MLEILSLISGFVSPWIGDVIGLFKAKQQNAHELQMLQESNKSAREIAELSAQVGMAQADVEDVRSARATQASYGTALLDAMSDGNWMERWIVKPLLVLALTAIEIANGFMRPWVIYLISGMWAASKAARFYFGYQAALGGGTSKVEVLAALASAALDIWQAEDNLFMEYVVGFLLGSRHKLKEAGAK